MVLEKIQTKILAAVTPFKGENGEMQYFYSKNVPFYNLIGRYS
jgi:hypothetical protein